ncbi:hypothetical protein M422DRAFT_53933 [Sphaerobolus stellatus SS14]|uniref:Uncharacterized protein n=1 Tax=Sphaerobolus stellatus (strain SS14) TaxID=990650 RepID=A0A0C9U6X4_SPHS4|nr:hypothetical protein M422DRAFT_53933 [Sphaerobolus stellatus SS14]
MSSTWHSQALWEWTHHLSVKGDHIQFRLSENHLPDRVSCRAHYGSMDGYEEPLDQRLWKRVTQICCKDINTTYGNNDGFFWPSYKKLIELSPHALSKWKNLKCISALEQEVKHIPCDLSYATSKKSMESRKDVSDNEEEVEHDSVQSMKQGHKRVGKVIKSKKYISDNEEDTEYASTQLCKRDAQISSSDSEKSTQKDIKHLWKTSPDEEDEDIDFVKPPVVHHSRRTGKTIMSDSSDEDMSDNDKSDNGKSDADSDDDSIDDNNNGGIEDTGNDENTNNEEDHSQISQDNSQRKEDQEDQSQQDAIPLENICSIYSILREQPSDLKDIYQSLRNATGTHLKTEPLEKYAKYLATFCLWQKNLLKSL